MTNQQTGTGPMGFMAACVGMAVLLLTAASPAAAQLSTYQEEKGPIHITSDPEGVPDSKGGRRKLFLQKTKEPSAESRDRERGAARGVYSYQDEKGMIHITDDPANVPESQRKPEPSAGQRVTGPSGISRRQDAVRAGTPDAGPPAGSDKCSAQLKQRLEDCQYHYRASKSSDAKRKELAARDVFTIHKMCGDLLLRPRFNGDEQRWIKSLSQQADTAAKELTTAERYEIEALVKAFYGPCGVTREPDPPELDATQLDIHLKELFRGMAGALGRDDLDKASSYFLEPYQESRKKQYAALSPEGRKKMSKDLLSSQLAVERVEDGRAIYHLITVQNGTRYSFQLTFVRSIHGIWKIHSF